MEIKNGCCRDGGYLFFPIDIEIRTWFFYFNRCRMSAFAGFILFYPKRSKYSITPHIHTHTLMFIFFFYKTIVCVRGPSCVVIRSRSPLLFFPSFSRDDADVSFFLFKGSTELKKDMIRHWKNSNSWNVVSCWSTLTRLGWKETRVMLFHQQEPRFFYTHHHHSSIYIQAAIAVEDFYSHQVNIYLNVESRQVTEQILLV